MACPAGSRSIGGRLAAAIDEHERGARCERQAVVDGGAGQQIAPQPGYLDLARS